MMIQRGANVLLLITSILTAALLAQSPDSIFVSGVVVDAAGKPLVGVDVVLPVRRPADGSLPTLAQGVTTRKGRSVWRSPGNGFRISPFCHSSGPFVPTDRLPRVRS